MAFNSTSVLFAGLGEGGAEGFEDDTDIQGDRAGFDVVKVIF